MQTKAESRWEQITAPKTVLPWRDEWTWKRRCKHESDRLNMYFGERAFFGDSDLMSVSESERAFSIDFWKNGIGITEVFIIHIDTENETRSFQEYWEDVPEFEKGNDIEEPSVLFVVDENMLDWDARIENPPAPRWSRSLKVRFKYAGRSRPIPIKNSWD